MIDDCHRIEADKKFTKGSIFSILLLITIFSFIFSGCDSKTDEVIGSEDNEVIIVNAISIDEEPYGGAVVYIETEDGKFYKAGPRGTNQAAIALLKSKDDKAFTMTLDMDYWTEVDEGD